MKISEYKKNANTPMDNSNNLFPIGEYKQVVMFPDTWGSSHFFAISYNLILKRTQVLIKFCGDYMWINMDLNYIKLYF